MGEMVVPRGGLAPGNNLGQGSKLPLTQNEIRLLGLNINQAAFKLNPLIFLPGQVKFGGPPSSWISST